MPPLPLLLALPLLLGGCGLFYGIETIVVVLLVYGVIDGLYPRGYVDDEDEDNKWRW